MDRKRGVARGAFLLAAAALLTMTIAIAAEPGSSKDPLVTLSYLNETYFDSIMDEVDARIARRDQKLAEQIGSSTGGTSSSGEAGSTFTVVTLTQGQTLTGSIGCEVMLRVGSASCVAASSPGLVDETAGTTLAGGSALVQNHLYMMTVEGRGVKATAATTKLLVRGGYTIG